MQPSGSESGPASRSQSWGFLTILIADTDADSDPDSAIDSETFHEIAMKS
jgi:hypothetical protein